MVKTFTLADVEELVEKYEDDDIINFGTEKEGADDALIEKAEKVLGLQLTTSYKVFLKTYSGGEIGSAEIYSLYKDYWDAPDPGVFYSGDIVFNYRIDVKSGTFKSQQLVVCDDGDFDEYFYFDYSQFKDGECPIYRWYLGTESHYASNFYEFLCKRIKEYSE